MNESPRAWPDPASLAALGPTISFAFNLGKIPDQGEDSDPILRDGPDLGLLGVFDGMGGAGGTVYETPEGRRTGAYLASRIARDVVEQRMLDLLEPDWHLNGKAAARNLQHAVQQALKQRLQELNPAPSSLRSRLLQRESKVGAQHPNNFLASLPAKDFELLRPHLKPFDMVHEDLLFDAGDIIHWVYLPHSGVISLVVGLADGRLIEAAMVGRDSLVGARPHWTAASR